MTSDSQKAIASQNVEALIVVIGYLVRNFKLVSNQMGTLIFSYTPTPLRSAREILGAVDPILLEIPKGTFTNTNSLRVWVSSREVRCELQLQGVRQDMLTIPVEELSYTQFIDTLGQYVKDRLTSYGVDE